MIRTPPAPRDGLAYAALAAVALLALALCVRTITETDLGFHLRAGEWMLENGRWPAGDLFTYTVNGRPYNDSHWLFQVLFALINRLSGAAGLVAAQTLLILSAFTLAAAAAWTQPRPPLALAALLLLGVLASEIRFTPRPELVSWVLLALTLLITLRHARGRPAPLWALPLIQLVWVNTEGLFMLGWGVAACVLAGRWLETRRLDRALAAWAGAGVLVSVVNPYGLNLVLFPFSLLGQLSRGSAFGQTISEFVSPWDLGFFAQTPFYARASVWSYYALAVVTGVALALSWRRRPPWRPGGRAAEVLLALVFFGLSAQAIRNVPLFVLAALPAAAGALADLPDALQRRPAPARRGGGRRAPRGQQQIETPPRSLRPWQLIASALLALVALGLTARVVTNAYYIDDRRDKRFGVTFSTTGLPVRAVEFMRAQGITGRLLNHLAYGGYLMWQLREPVFADGRLDVMGEQFYAEYLTTDTQLPALLERYDAQVAIFPYRSGGRTWLLQLNGLARWRLVYVDEETAIYLRDDANPAIPALAVPAATPGGVSIPVGDAQRAALLYAPRVSRLPAWLSGFYAPQAFPDEAAGLGVLYLYLEQPDPAEAYLLDALQQSQGRYYEIYANLAGLYYRKQRMREAIYCYQMVLADQPGNALARQRLRELGGIVP
jgi:tetratricopeptide (TPR) repeat protein